MVYEFRLEFPKLIKECESEVGECLGLVVEDAEKLSGAEGLMDNFLFWMLSTKFRLVGLLSRPSSPVRRLLYTCAIFRV